MKIKIPSRKGPLTVVLTGTLTLMLIPNCTGDARHPEDCEGNVCTWDYGQRTATQCCPSSAPYCGREGSTNCPKGRCCASPAVSTTLKPLD